MKRHITYIAMLLTALTGASCSQDETPAGDGRTGVMAMTISTSRAETNGEYGPLQYQKVYIYNSEGGLLRKYAAKDDIPERLELLSGTYRVAVEAGEEVPADFSKRFYKGEETFTVKPGETTNAEVVCKIANTVVEVKFDASIVENLDPGYFVWIAGTDKFDEAEASRVRFLRSNSRTKARAITPCPQVRLRWRGCSAARIRRARRSRWKTC